MPSIDFSNLPGQPSRSPRTSLKWIAGICATAVLVALGSTLASNINLNGGGNVEFGQGQTVATACDNAITVTPQSSFVNAPTDVTGTFTRTVGSWGDYQFEIADKSGLYVGQRISSSALGAYAVIQSIAAETTPDTSGNYGQFPNPTSVYIVTFTGPRAYDQKTVESMTFSGGGFYFTSFSVTDISADCYGKPFTIRAYKNGVNTPLPLYQTNGTSNYSEINVIDNGGSFSFTNGGLLSDDIHNITDGFKVDLVTVGPPPSVPLSLASDVDRITIESGASTELTINSLNGYSFTPSQFGVGDPVGLYAGSCTPPSCFPYMRVKDWMDHYLDSDLASPYWGNLFGPGTTRDQAESEMSFMFISRPSNDLDHKWVMVILVNGTPFGPTYSGYIVSFDGQSGLFISVDTGLSIPWYFATGTLMGNSPTLSDQFQPYIDQPSRRIPLRNFKIINPLNNIRYSE